MVHIGQTFENIPVCLDGGTFQGCTFRQCKLLFGATLPVSLVGCTFDGCSWHFIGAASTALQFMQQLYAGGATDLVNQTLAAIKGEAKFPFTVGNA